MIIFVCIFGFILGIALCIYSAKKPIVIEFSYSWDAWAGPILIAFSLLVASFGGELFISNKVLSYYNDRSILGFWISILFENGLLIPFICALLSYIFEKLVEKANLDYFEYYSNLIAKICFTILDFSFCFALLKVLKTSEISGEYHFIACRIIMWILAALGIWIGFGFGCEGRLEKENRKREQILEKQSKKEIILFWIPIAWPLLLCLFLLFITYILDSDTTRYDLFACIFAAAFSVAGIVTMIICKNIYNPNEKHSRRGFYKLIRAYQQGKIVSKNYGRNKYHIKEGVLVIEKVKIKYPGHENDEEFIRLFDEINYEINFKDWDGTLDFLRNRDNEQNHYIELKYKECIEEKKKQVLKPI